MVIYRGIIIGVFIAFILECLVLNLTGDFLPESTKTILFKVAFTTGLALFFGIYSYFKLKSDLNNNPESESSFDEDID